MKCCHFYLAPKGPITPVEVLSDLGQQLDLCTNGGPEAATPETTSAGAHPPTVAQEPVGSGLLLPGDEDEAEQVGATATVQQEEGQRAWWSSAERTGQPKRCGPVLGSGEGPPIRGEARAVLCLAELGVGVPGGVMRTSCQGPARALGMVRAEAYG